MRRKPLLLIIPIVLCLLISFSFAESYDASTMRLLRHDGTVQIYDVSGAPRFLLVNVRFASGEAMETGEDGTASVSLDDSKIVSLDKLSFVEFMQESDHIRLNLKKGTIFLDVSEKLDENAGLDIQTSTMIIGVRGTSGYVDSDENGNSVIYLTTGKVEVTGLEEGEEFDSDKIKPAQKLTVDAKSSTLIVEDVTEFDLPSEMVITIVSDDDLLEKVVDETDWDEDTLVLLDDLYRQGYTIDEILEQGLASAEDDNLVADYTFDIEELTGTWFGDGENFISLYGDGTGLLMYRAYNPVHPDDNDNFIPFSLTYEVSENSLIFKDPVNFPDGVECRYFMMDGTLVLYDSYHDRLLVKDNRFTIPEDWHTSVELHPATLADN